MLVAHLTDRRRHVEAHAGVAASITQAADEEASATAAGVASDQADEAILSLLASSSSSCKKTVERILNALGELGCCDTATGASNYSSSSTSSLTSLTRRFALASNNSGFFNFFGLRGKYFLIYGNKGSLVK